MTTYSVGAAKARFSEVLRKVKAKNEVVVTDRGKPIARIIPYRNSDDESLDARWDRLLAQGRIIDAAELPSTLPTDFAPVPGGLERFLADR